MISSDSLWSGNMRFTNGSEHFKSSPSRTYKTLWELLSGVFAHECGLFYIEKSTLPTLGCILSLETASVCVWVCKSCLSTQHSLITLCSKIVFPLVISYWLTFVLSTNMSHVLHLPWKSVVASLLSSSLFPQSPLCFLVLFFICMLTWFLSGYHCDPE